MVFITFDFLLTEPEIEKKRILLALRFRAHAISADGEKGLQARPTKKSNKVERKKLKEYNFIQK